MRLMKVVSQAVSKVMHVLSGDSREVCTKHKFVVVCKVGDEFDGFDKLLVCDYCGQECLQHYSGKFELVPAYCTEGEGE